MTIPFSEHFTADLPAANNKHRLKIFRKFIGAHSLGNLHVLDIGRPNFISRELKVTDNTVGDLNRGIKAPSNNYDAITCFEVLNHVMNALVLVQGMYDLLKPGGALYFSTPKLWLIPWYHGKENFVEYKVDRIKKLFEYAGFDVVRYECHNPWPPLFVFYGIRPPLRYLFNRFQLWEFKKP
jgi:SAM-dependent methyltransferase